MRQFQPVPAQHPMHDGLDLQLAERHADAFVRTTSPRPERIPMPLPCGSCRSSTEL
jgi:hypothetical protein